MADFTGEIALVTGGASGIGAATTRMLNERGAHVVVLDRDPAALANVSDLVVEPRRVEGRLLDVTDRSAVEGAVASVVEDHGRIDVLVNNAGITGPSSPLWEVDPDFWHRIYDVHVNGTFYLLRSVLPHMIAAGYGRVVNVASVAGKEGNANSAPYSSAKAAVLGLTKSLGKELATTGVLVNAITPGQFDTPIMKDVTPSHHQVLLAKIPMGRMGQPEEAAEMIAFLASRRTSFSTGAVFDLSGGRTTY
ncbi:SDR family NAD(P)-dependent oxidoreductase [Aeromicrobium chenweiae]|nr:SDR family NAD(P)-dependent oxidoreductase [Aeromicrobium chenweiae]